MKKTNCPNLAKNLIILLILSLVFAVLFSGSIYALSSDNINLQGKIVRNDIGHEGLNVIPGSPACVVNGPGNDTCDFRVLYYTALTGGTLLLTEDFTNVEIGQFDGVFELSLGSGTVTTTGQCRDGTCNSPSEVISEYKDLYIELQFAPDGSTLTETFTRMPLEASPYAIFSKFAEGAHDAFKLSTSVSNESLENPSAGMIYFDTGSSQLKVYNGAEWQGLSAGTSSSLWTDAGTYSYLTSTTDDLVLGGSSFNTGRFVFDMDGGSGSYFDVFNNDHSNKLFTILNSGNVGIGTATPGAKLEVGGTASVISNNSGDITIDPVSNLVVTSRVYQTGLGGSTYFGENAGRVDDLSSNYNTGIGYRSLYSNTTGYFNTALGPYSLYSNITGYSNTALGYRSLYSNTSGDSNTAVGNNSLYSNTTGYFNTALGNNSLSSNITGNSNTAVGNNSLYSNTTGIYNTAVGHASLYFNTTGNYNTVLGYASLYSNTTGSYNTALGYYAGAYQADGVTALTDSENSIYIGYNAKGKDNDDNNSIVIGYNAVGLGANTVVLGNDSIVTTALRGNVGIGTTSPTQKLDVSGGIRLGTTSNINNVLDTQAQSGAPSGSLYWGNAPLLTSANLGSFGVASIINSDGTLTISPTVGNVTASLNLSNANIWTGAQTFSGNTYFPGSGIWNTLGNVGIGTTTPRSELEVVGSITLDDEVMSVTDVTFDGDTSAGLKLTNPRGYITLTPLNTGWAHIYTDRSKFIFNKPVYSIVNTFSSYNADLLLQRVGVTKITVGSTLTAITDNLSVNGTGNNYFAGNVGIGTTTPSSLFSIGPSSQFQVNSSGDIVKLKNLTYSWPSSHTTNGFLKDDGSGGLSWTTIAEAGGVTGTGTPGYLPKWNTSSDLNNSVIYQNGSNVGIGTTSPSSTLHIQSSTPTATFTTTRATGGVAFNIFDLGISNAGGSADWISIGAYGSADTLNFNYLYFGDAYNNNALRIYPNKNVGVYGDFQIGGITTINSSRIATLADGNAGGPAYSFTNNTNMGMFRAATDQLGFATAGSEAMRISASGSIGIGITSPTQKLDVLGGIRLGTTSNVNNVLDTQAQGGAPSGNLYWGNSPLLTSDNLGSFGVTSVSNSDGTLTISPTIGNVIASLNLSHANTWTGMQTFRGLTVDSATATDDRILTSITTGGSTRYDGTLTNADLTAARTWTLPNKSGTIAMTSDIPVSDNYQYWVLQANGVAGSNITSTSAVSFNGSGIVTTSRSGNVITITGTEADTLQSVTNRGATTTVSSSFTGGATIRGLIVDNATATHDRILTTVASVGTARYDGTLTNADLTAARTWTLPNNSGTIALTSDIPAGHDPVTLSGENYLSLNVQQITANKINLTSNVTGTLPIGSGGTNSTTYTSNQFLWYNGTSIVASGYNQSSFASSSHSHNWSQITNGSSIYMDYRPNNTACGLNQVLKYDSTNSRWVCADDNAGTGDNWGSQVVITNSTLTGNGTSGSPLGIALNNANTWTGMQTFRGLTVDSATATDDRILTSITTGGSTRYDGTLTNADLTAARTWTLPNATGTIALTSNIITTFLGLTDTPSSYTGSGNYLVRVNSTATALEFVEASAFTDTDNYVDSVSFNTGDGVLTLGRTGALPDLTTNLDGRYLQSLRWNEIQNPQGYLTLDHGMYSTLFTFNGITNSTAFSMTSSSLATGYILGLSTTSTALTEGGALDISASGTPSSSWTGNLARIEYNSGSSNVNGSALKVGLLGASAGSGTALNVTTSQTGVAALALRVNDDSTYTDPSPFVVDANGNVGVGVVSPTSKLVVNSEGYSTIELQYNDTPVVDIFSNVSSNIFIGLDSGSVITSGYGNVALGDNALSATTIGTSNTAVGHYALDSNVAKQGSTAIGYQAMMYADSTATQGLSYNTAVGYQALVGSATASANTGMYNTAIGHQSMTVNTSGSYNSTLGVNTLLNNTIGRYNVAIGYGALFTNVAKNASVAIGYEAMRYADNTVTSSKSGNIAIGYQALRGSTTASSNMGTDNVAIGYQALYENTTGSGSVLIGAYAGTGNTTGEFNVGIGIKAFQTNVAKSNNVAVGYGAMSYANNSASVGDTYNTALGAFALMGSSIPENNTGVYNTSIGGNSGFSMTSGSNNALLGYYAGYSITTGSNNSLFGYYAGSNLTTGSNNIIIGANISADSATGSYQLNIGNAIKGNLSTGDINIVGNLGINGVPYTWPSVNGSGLLTNNGSGGLSWTTSAGLGLVSGTGSAGQISYWSGTTSITGSNSFWWDSTNNRLGIGTNNPQASIDIAGATSTISNASGNISILPASNILSINGLVYQTGLGSSTYFGENAGRVDDLSSNYNTGIGYNSLYSNTTGIRNTAVGYYSLYSNTTGNYNTAVGYNSLRLNTAGGANTALGYYSLYSNTGVSNTALGYYSLYSNTTGNSNTALGPYSLYSNTTGGYNTALGYNAGRYQVDGSTALTDPEYSIYIGYNAKGYDNNDYNSIVIGYNAVGLGANTVVLGNDNIVTTVLKGNVGIGTTTPGAKLEIADAGVLRVLGTSTAPSWPSSGTGISIGYDTDGTIISSSGGSGAGSISVSDSSTNVLMPLRINVDGLGITDGPGVARLVIGSDGYTGIGVTSPTYRLQLPNTADNAGKGQANAWVTYSDISLKENIQTISGGLDKIMALRGVTFDWKGQGVASSGFIAQEVEPIIPDLVSTDINGIKSLDYGRFTPYLVEAIKEQQLQIQTAYNRIEQLENINENKIRSITTPGWYRISKLDTNDDHSNIKINNTSVGSSQNIVLSIDSTLNNQNINIVSNLTTGGYDITKARINNENGIKYLEIYIPEVNENKISVKITESSNWITTDIVQITEEVNNTQEYALNGILFGISDKLEIEEDNVKIAGDLLSLSVNSSIGDSANRWNDIYAKGTIRLGSGADGEGAIRFNVQTKTLEFSNNGVEWLSVGDLSSQMTISPEYAGAILFADGSDNSGIMTSDAVEESGSFKNYYEWVSNKDTPQDYDILVRITLPADFLSWKEDAIYLDFMTENSVNTDNNSVGLSLIGNSGTDVQISGGISKIAGAWERMSIKGADITQCNSAGGTCTLRISLTSSMEYFTRVGDITLNYNRSL